jgi:hypothetical protein
VNFNQAAVGQHASMTSFISFTNFVKLMQDLITKVISNPLYLTIGVILLVVLLYGIIKRIIKLLIILFIALVLFLVYVHYTGSTVRDEIERMK